SRSSESCSSDRRPCSCDLFLGIAVNAKHIVVLCFRGLARWTKIGVHILPNDFTVRCHLKKASKPSIIDEGIPIGQALSVGNAGTEEVRRDSLFVLHTISLVRGFTSMTREKGKLSSKRCVRNFPVVEESTFYQLSSRRGQAGRAS